MSQVDFIEGELLSLRYVRTQLECRLGYLSEKEAILLRDVNVIIHYLLGRLNYARTQVQD